MEKEVKEWLDKFTKKPLAMKFRDISIIKEWKKVSDEDQTLIKIAKGDYRPNHYFFELIVKFDKDNAVLKDTRENPSFENALYTLVIAGKKTSTYYSCLDEAILGYLGIKNLGSDSGFSHLAFKMLKV